MTPGQIVRFKSGKYSVSAKHEYNKSITIGIFWRQETEKGIAFNKSIEGWEIFASGGIRQNHIISDDVLTGMYIEAKRQLNI